MAEQQSLIFSTPESVLRIDDHRRDVVGMRYVYPVVSRRAGGVSVGVNLNVNNACNWACVYCQVPNLSRGGAPEIDLRLLQQELMQMFTSIFERDFMVIHVDANMRRLADVAFSGNGEPTASPQFLAAVQVVRDVLISRGLLGVVPLRLITNGSLLHRPLVQSGIKLIGESAGEIWFKVDRASSKGLRAVNQTVLSVDQIKNKLLQCAALAPTWIQTCWFGLDSSDIDESEFVLFLGFLAEVAAYIRGVHLYGVVRPSMQSATERLFRVGQVEMEKMANRIRKIGITVQINP